MLIVILQNIKPVKIAPKRKKTSKPELFESEEKDWFSSKLAGAAH